ncbi:MAG: hypothetical protein AB1553_01970 [Nitrospirota bacterium]
MKPFIDTVEPVTMDDLRKAILVPREDFEKWLELHNWTYHQLARKEYPEPYEDLQQFQLACYCSSPLLWIPAFLREPEDPDHQDSYTLWDYQEDSIAYPGHTIHKCGAEVGKTREIVAYALYKAFTVQNGSGLIGAPQQTHLDEIIEAMLEQLDFNEDLKPSLVEHKKHPHHRFRFDTRFKLYFRPAGHDGEAYRGIHVRTFAIKDEAAKLDHKKQWSEFFRAVKPGCVVKLYSVPDGRRDTEFYRLSKLAEGEKDTEIEAFKEASNHIKEIKFQLFKWPKMLMPSPYWSPERKKFYIDLYGGEDSPEYKHNVLGEDGDPANSVFPWQQFRYCIKEIPEYRALKIMVDSANGEVSAYGYRCEYVAGDSGPVPKAVTILDTTYRLAGFFDYVEGEESEFRKLIKSFFDETREGAKEGGGDFGYTGDPTELIVHKRIGKKDRWVARLQLRQVTYDQQCQALDAIDDIFEPKESLGWGTDFGNAGSAVAHDLQGLPQYRDKDYDDRLRGFMFESTTDNVDEEGTPIIDAKTGKPAKITLKELATDILVKKMQRMELEYPPDPDIVVSYTGHTCTYGSKHRIYSKSNDHLIDADRARVLAKLFMNETGRDDVFASGN